jgi:hypothetical protein
MIERLGADGKFYTDSKAEERVWAYLLKHRATADAIDIALNCDITEAEAQSYIDRISSETWRHNLPTRDHNIGESNYAKHKIQPWDIWLEYQLDPWDADIIKRVLRDKPGQRRLDYEKIKHVCDERIRQIDAELDEVSHVSLERKESAAA